MISLTPPEHEHSALIDEAAAWLATRSPQERQRPAVVELRERYGLSAVEACQAMRQSNLLKGGAA